MPPKFLPLNGALQQLVTIRVIPNPNFHPVGVDSMSTVNADVKLTDSLERQLTEQALNRQAEEGLNFSALL